METIGPKSVVKRIVLWANVATILSLLVAVVSLFLQAVALKGAVLETRGAVERMEKSVAEDRFAIVYPPSGFVVGPTDFVRGRMPFKKKNLYLVVTPLATGQPALQQDRVSLSGDEWQGIARFGTAAVGGGDMFSVKAIATDDELSQTTLANLPPDAIVSSEIVVKRGVGAKRE